MLLSMRGTYCPHCDETRWQLMGLSVTRSTTCSGCGAELQPERRTPGRKRIAEALSERRLGLADRPAGGTPAGTPG